MDTIWSTLENLRPEFRLHPSQRPGQRRLTGTQRGGRVGHVLVVGEGGQESSTAAQGRLPGTAAYRRVVAALFAAGLATFTLLYSTQAILPQLSARFGVSTEASTLTVSLTTLGLGAALLVAGPISDRRGRTGLIHFLLAASSVIAIVCAFSPNSTTLLTLRLLEGVALAGLPAVATAYLREELHPSHRLRAAGLYIGGTAFGG